MEKGRLEQAWVGQICTEHPSRLPWLTFFGCLLSECSFSFASVEVQMNVDRQMLHCEVRGVAMLF